MIFIVYQQYSSSQMNKLSTKQKLAQLKQIKQNILKTIPKKELEQYLNYQEKYIEQENGCKKINLCCFTQKYKKVDKSFKETFQRMDEQERIEHYQKILKITQGIINKKKALPQTVTQLEQLSGSQQIEINRKLQKSWRKQKVRINYNKKIIQAKHYKLDLRHYLIKRKVQNYISLILLRPIAPNKPNYQFASDKVQFEELFQRLDKLVDDCLEENIIRIIEGDTQIIDKLEVQECIGSQRQICQFKKQNQLKQSRTSSLRNNNNNIETANYLKCRHPVEARQKDIEPNLLVPFTDIHYLLEGEFKITEDGELIVSNQLKLEEQSNVIKYIIKRVLSGSKVFSISLPVQVFSCESNLSLLVSSFRFAPLILQNAAKLQSLQRFKQIFKFALTCPACYIRCDKPFNPIIGQTYQRIIDGTLFYGQQVSHHPPISAAFVKGRGYTLYGSFQAEVQFGINSATGNNKGWVKISFDSKDYSKKVVKFTNSPGQMGGLIFGKRSLNLIKSVYFIDQENYLFCELFFGKIKHQKNVKTYKDSIEGKIFALKKSCDLSKPQEIGQKDIQSYCGLIHGQWLSDIYFNDEFLINTRKQYPPAIDSYNGLLKSDYSFRQDIILRIGGPSEECQNAKQRLQQLQRNDKKLRQKYK